MKTIQSLLLFGVVAQLFLTGEYAAKYRGLVGHIVRKACLSRGSFV
jgi:hypothetical protein